MGFLRTERNHISLLTNALGTQAQKGMDGNNLLSWVTQTQVKLGEDGVLCGPYLDHVVEYMSVHTILALCGRACSVFLLGVLVFFHLYMDVLHSG
jgi:hypothetical protein